MVCELYLNKFVIKKLSFQNSFIRILRTMEYLKQKKKKGKNKRMKLTSYKMVLNIWKVVSGEYKVKKDFQVHRGKCYKFSAWEVYIFTE